jgi:predicted Zn-dependent protease
MDGYDFERTDREADERDRRDRDRAELERLRGELKDWIAQLKDDRARSGSVYMTETTDDVIRNLRAILAPNQEDQP